jgi:hypothetical protein
MLGEEPTLPLVPQESPMIGSTNTCSRCRFFSRNACSTRHCYDWRADRSSRDPEWDEDERDEDPDDARTEEP